MHQETVGPGLIRAREMAYYFDAADEAAAWAQFEQTVQVSGAPWQVSLFEVTYEPGSDGDATD